MIVSCSRRADIPALEADRFAKWLESGEVRVANPFNPGQETLVSLRREDVDAFVFWTRNPAPFSRPLERLQRQGYPFYVMVTINRYPAVFEPGAAPLPEVEHSLATLYDRIGPRRIIWRYDPIIISPLTGIAFHQDNFHYLADRLSRYCRRVVVSFLDLYAKVRRRLAKSGIDEISGGLDFAGRDALLSSLVRISREHDLEIQSCAEPLLLEEFGIRHGKCIDDGLLNDLFGLGLAYRKDPHQRPACGCQRSVDIGQYRTCRMQCLYCYAR